MKNQAKPDLYQTVTDTIIAALEKGPKAFRRCWKSTMPVNASTGRSYSGINVLLLWLAADKAGYTSSEWLTYKQAEAVGAQVRKGEKGTHIVFFKPLKVKKTDDKGKEVERTVPLLRGFVVFNREQIDGLPESEAVEGIEDLDAFVRQTGAIVKHGEPAYSPGKDVVYLPTIDAFDTVQHYYATAFHELSHWTGHKSRLDRDLKGRFGDESYAAEELIAELSAAFLCAHAHIEGDLRHAGYIKSWLRVLRNDKRAIFTAAKHATAASEYLLDCQSVEQAKAA